MAKKLSDKVWETRKARINTEKRLKRYALFSEILIPWFSIHLIILSFFNDEKIKYFSIIISLIILIFSIILTSQNFRVRAREMKQHYIKLEELYQKIKVDESHELYSSYLDMLNQVENHNQYDYINVVMELRKEKNKTIRNPTCSDWLKVILQFIVWFFAISFSILLPLAFEAIVIYATI